MNAGKGRREIAFSGEACGLDVNSNFARSGSNRHGRSDITAPGRSSDRELFCQSRASPWQESNQCSASPNAGCCGAWRDEKSFLQSQAPEKEEYLLSFSWHDQRILATDNGDSVSISAQEWIP
jgi:hypothetical protein